MSSSTGLGSRPLVPLVVSLAAGIACARLLGLPLAVPPLVISLILTAVGLAVARGPKSATRLGRMSAAAFLCLAAAAFGWFLWVRAEKKAVPPPSAAVLLDGTERRYRVLIKPFPEVYAEKKVFPVTLLSVAEKPNPSGSPPRTDHHTNLSSAARTQQPETVFTGLPPIGVRVSVGTLVRSWKAGDVVEMPLVLRPLTNFENPGRYDYVAEMARRGIFARASTKSDIFWVSADPFTKGVSRAGAAFFGAVDAFRGHLRSLLVKNLTGPEGALAQALFLGYRGAVPRPIHDHFQRAGVVHLLAISGLHVGLAAWAAFRLAQLSLRFFWPQVLLRIPDVHLAWWAGCAAAAVYALVAGFAVPTQRALIMLAAAAVAMALYRRPDPLSLLSAAAGLILWADPNHLFRPSFQLSFAAVAGLGFLYPPWRGRAQRIISHLPKKLTPLGRLFLDAFLVSLAASLAVAPLTAYHFQGISLAGLAANTIIVPFLALAVLPPGLAALGISALVPSFAPMALLPIGWVLRTVLRLIESFAALPYAFAFLGPISLTAVMGFYAGLILWAFSMPLSKKLWASAALAALGVLFAVSGPWASTPPKENLFEVTVLDVGQGSATLVRCPPDAAMLVDGGGFYDDSFDVGRHVVARALWAMGVRRLDAVVLSHDHPDHRNGLRYILETFPVGRYVETGLGARSLSGSTLTAVAARRGIPTLHTLVQSREDPNGTVDLGALGACRLKVLHPAASFVRNVWDGKDLNEVSLVLAVTYGKAAVLLPGDIGTGTEQSLLDRWNFAEDQWLVVAPHHGSASSTSESLLNRSAPRAMLISCGFDNPFGFPALSVLQRLRERAVPVFRTDLHGAIHAAWDGSRWTVIPTLERRPLLYNPTFSADPRLP